jgi:hypothetical protein
MFGRSGAIVPEQPNIYSILAATWAATEPFPLFFDLVGLQNEDGLGDLACSSWCGVRLVVTLVR